MANVKRISTEDKSTSVEIHQRADGMYTLQKYVQKYDFEEEVFYEVRMTPDPAGLFSDIETATKEAKVILGLN
jgi:hypothetical protein